MAPCPNCGSALPEDARFCLRCGVPQRRAEGAAAFAAPGNTASRNDTWVVCEVVWWRGYSRSDFYARAIAPDRDVEVARSPEFWWPHDNPPPPEHAQAHAAHATLVRKLISTGWEPLGGSSPWYAQRFRRLGALPEAHDANTVQPGNAGHVSGQQYRVGQ